jgi:glycosyltransferase involved in cell wall biosynthesis
MPELTMAIPTYNREHLLPAALDSALAQTVAHRVRVVVRDNASTDGTAAMLSERYPDVAYHRAEVNEGGSMNFHRSLLLAETPYFSWLQDDDRVHAEFAERALGALTRDPDIMIYTGFALMVADPWSLCYPQLWGGAAIRLDPMQVDGVRVVDGKALLPFLVLDGLGFCPSAAFRREELAQVSDTLLQPYELFTERMVLARLAVRGKVAIDPRVVATFRIHEGAAHRQRQAKQRKAQQFAAMARDLADLAVTVDWQSGFKPLLAEVAQATRLNWLDSSLDWPRNNPLLTEVRELLLASFDVALQRRVTGWRAAVRRAAKHAAQWSISRMLG